MNTFSIWKRPFINDHCSNCTHIFIYGIVLNFLGSSTICKIFQQKILMHDTHTFHALTAGVSMDNIPGLSCWIHKKLSSKRYLQSRHCFTDSGKLEWMTVWQWCELDKSGLSATPIVYHVCSVHMQQIYKFIQQNFQNSLLVKIHRPLNI